MNTTTTEAMPQRIMRTWRLFAANAITDASEPALLTPTRWRDASLVNLNGDLFHPDVPDEFIMKVIGITDICRHHTSQILTKRAERMSTIMVTPLPNVHLCVLWR